MPLGFASDSAWLGDGVGTEALTRAERELAGALRRRPTAEGRVAGSLRELAICSPRLLAAVSEAAEVLVRRGSVDRALYSAAIRVVAEREPARAVAILERALEREDAGGIASLAACVEIPAPQLGAPLARVARGRHPQLAFAAEVARLARGETDGRHIADLAPKIKESHRLTLCAELLVPLQTRHVLPSSIAVALQVLRDTERHLGRWLVFAEVGTRAGDSAPLEEARRRGVSGPTSSQLAWSLLAWALGGGPPPPARPSAELVARLSDRPSSDRDLTFLFRLAHARVDSARSLLEHLTRGPGLRGAVAIRAALYLVRDHGREDLRRELMAVAANPRFEALRGLAAAVLLEAGEQEVSAGVLMAPLLRSRQLATVSWAVLGLAHANGWLPGTLVTEARFRRIEAGWIE